MRKLALAGLCAAAGLAGCASGRGSGAAPAAAHEDFGLPPVHAPLVFPPGKSEVTLGWLVSELGRLTGQELAMQATTRAELQTVVEPLVLQTPVPADEVYAFVEGLLVRNGLHVAPLTGGPRAVLGVYGAHPNDVAPNPVAVEPAQLAALERHPALLCQLLLTFENIDSRQLQTQLRQLLVESTGATQVVPCGERSLLIQAPGARLLGLARTLSQVDRASAARPAAAAAAR